MADRYPLTRNLNLWYKMAMEFPQHRIRAASRKTAHGDGKLLQAEKENRDHVLKVRINATEHQWLRDIAALEDRSVSAVLRLALKEFYERRTG